MAGQDIQQPLKRWDLKASRRVHLEREWGRSGVVGPYCTAAYPTDAEMPIQGPSALLLCCGLRELLLLGYCLTTSGILTYFLGMLSKKQWEPLVQRPETRGSSIALAQTQVARLRNIVQGRENGSEKHLPIIIISISCMCCRCHGLIRQGFCVYAFVFIRKTSPFVRDETCNLEGVICSAYYLDIIN